MTKDASAQPSKKSLITKKALIITGAVVGAFAVGYLLKKTGADKAVEALVE